ncbi:MAG: hypothetical protein J6X57_06635 [Bacteroidales bacterium]|nr:hypothetical protein [Bacteroidales bacterium]
MTPAERIEYLIHTIGGGHPSAFAAKVGMHKNKISGIRAGRSKPENR